MIQRYAEVSCDNCGCACHYPIGNGSIESQAREEGWIITADGPHYDTKECYKESLSKKEIKND